MTVRPTANSRSLVESLESRQLLSSVSVTAFGAKPNDGVDDSYQIQRAINASAPGNTISFPAGDFNVSRYLETRGNRTYQGTDGTKLVNSSGDRVIFKVGEDNATFTHMVLEGQGIEANRTGGGMVSGLNVNHIRFNITGGGNITGLEFNTGLRNSRVTNNSFIIGAENGIYGYYWDNLVIANNEFLSPSGGVGGEGIHVIDCGTSSKDLLIEQNYFSGLHRMGIEYQGGGWNTIVQDNYYENPVLYSSFPSNNDTFAYSIIADKSQNTIVRRNTAIMPTSAQSPDHVGVRIAFELGGKNLHAYDNYTVGGNHVVAANGSHATGVAENNRFIAYRQPPSNANGSTVIFKNNGPDVQLSWDINRPKPGPDLRLAGGNDLPPLIDPPPGGTGDLKATAVSSSRVDLTWTDNAVGEIGYRVERSFDGAKWQQIALIAANGTHYSNTGLPANTKVYYRIRSYSARGFSDYSNVVEVTTKGGAGTTPPPATGPGGTITPTTPTPTGPPSNTPGGVVRNTPTTGGNLGDRTTTIFSQVRL